MESTNLSVIEGGYDYDHFVGSPPDNLSCPVCLLIAREAQRMDCCGKIYCKTCLDVNRRYSKRCPTCREMGTSFYDEKNDTVIRELEITCKNDQNGCEWHGKLTQLDEHSVNCEYTILNCPNNCTMSDGEKISQILKKDINKHIQEECVNREYECPHCKESAKYSYITTEHLVTCQEVRISCPNENCSAKVPRSKLDAHRNQLCPYEIVPCKYATLGCEIALPRKDIVCHEVDMQSHLESALKTLSKQQERMQAFEKEFSKQQELNMAIMHRLSVAQQTQDQKSSMKFVFKMPIFSQYRDKREAFYSPAFYSALRGYKMSIGVRTDTLPMENKESTIGSKGYVSVLVFLMRGEYDDNLSWPFTGRVKVQLLNQLSDYEHFENYVEYPQGRSIECSQRVKETERAKVGYGHIQFIKESELGYNVGRRCHYLKEDCLYFGVSVEATHSKPWLACNTSCVVTQM